MQHLRLTHPELDFWVDVRLREWDGKWLAVADFAGEPDVGTGTDPREATKEALAVLREPYASEMAERAELEADESVAHEPPRLCDGGGHGLRVRSDPWQDGDH